MGLKIEIDTGNDWFQGCVGESTASLVNGVADKLDRGEREGAIFDGNGNRVGGFKLEHTDAEDAD